jgi:ACS family pantothenate transporter-like MFS transporter
LHAEKQINFLVIFFSLIADWISDNLRGSSRWPIMAFSMTMGIIFPIALAATPVYPSIRAGRWALYCEPQFTPGSASGPLADASDLSALGTCSAGVTWTLVNEANRHDPEKRAYVSALVSGARTAVKLLTRQMNAFAYIFIAWVPIFTFPTSKQPVIIAGNYANAGFAAAGLVFAVLIGYMYKRDLAAAERAVQDQEALEGEKEKGSESGEETPGIDALPVVKTAELR